MPRSCKKNVNEKGFYIGTKSRSLKFSLGRFMIALCTMGCLIPCAFIFLKLFLAQLPSFKFPLEWIILIWFNGLKGCIFSLIVLLCIPIRLRPFEGSFSIRSFSMSFTVYVFGAALGFLIRVLRVIGAGCFWLRVLGLWFGFGNYGGALRNFAVYNGLHL